MKTISLILGITISFMSNWVNAQNFTQTIKGQIIDKQTQTPIIGGSVIVAESSPLIGAISDIDGYFKIENITTGRVSLMISYIGYETLTLNDLILTTGKELVLKIELEEKVMSAKEVVIRASKDKAETTNDMATVSARTFSVEESQKYAGARNDVSRMATNYAGVSTANDAINDIVIRGNSPTGLLWRLEGIEIPNPNHFGTYGLTGGPVSMLNNNVLSNSDFITSAFPAEYGNALSGIFDLKLRNGNYEKYEFLAQLGFNGFEFGAEGPISRKNNSSFLLNYRYSTMGLMSAMGINFGTGTAIPKYQDLSLKVNVPTKTAGIFDVFALAGQSSISFINSTKTDTTEDENFYNDDNTDARSNNLMGVLGISHKYIINPNTYTNLIVAATAIKNSFNLDSLVPITHKPFDKEDAIYNNSNFIASFSLNKKFDNRNYFRLGIKSTRLNFDFLDSTYMSEYNQYVKLIDYNDGSYLNQAYLTWQFKQSEKLTFNSGVHFEHFALNNNISLEPRVGIKYALTEKQSINLGYGLHSKLEPIFIYYNQVRIAENEYITPNQDLGFTKSHHVALGYDNNFAPKIRFKGEVYYQYIFDAVVEQKSSNFSMLNFGAINSSVPDSLTNGGKGTNYGIELTLEKFLSKGYYFLFTTSLFDSKYEGSDNVKRSTAFDGHYVVNFLGGKEIPIKTKKDNPRTKKCITIDWRLTAAGGARYTPVDIAKSMEEQQTVYLDDEAFSKHFKNYFRADLKIGMRRESKKVTQEIAIDLENVINRKNPLYMKFNPKTGEEEVVNQLGLFPMLTYRITF